METLQPTEFFKRVWPTRLLTNETLEMRYLDREEKGFVHRAFYQSIDSFLEDADRKIDYEIYFGVSTRYGTGTGKKRDCYRSQAVWVDFDNGEKKEWTLQRVAELDPKPDLLVDSGGGVHAYWLLRTPVLVRDEQRGAQLESINRGLVDRFGGDINTCDLTRILRVPGTFNHKYKPFRRVTAYSL